MDKTAIVQIGVAPVESVVNVMEPTCGLVELAQPIRAGRRSAKTARDRLRKNRTFGCIPRQNPLIKVAPGKVIPNNSN